MDEDALRASGASWRTDTAERPAVAVPPERAQPVASVAPVVPPRTPAEPPDPSRPGSRPPAPPWIAWAVVAALLVVAAYVGARLVLQPPGDDVAVDATPDRERQSANQQPEPSGPADEDGGSDTGEQQDEGDSADEPGSDPEPTTVAPIEATPEVSVPGSAPPNNDVTGELVTFGAANLVDGDPETCWRVAGDASGSVLRFTYPSEVTFARVGLINGYAKTSVDGSGRSFDWYAGNRRLTQVEWRLGGQVFSQTLGETTATQWLDIEPTPATTIELRIVGVTPPGPPPTGRDYTAISDVGFAGYED